MDNELNDLISNNFYAFGGAPNEGLPTSGGQGLAGDRAIAINAPGSPSRPCLKSTKNAALHQLKITLFDDPTIMSGIIAARLFRAARPYDAASHRDGRSKAMAAWNRWAGMGACSGARGV